MKSTLIKITYLLILMVPKKNQLSKILEVEHSYNVHSVNLVLAQLAHVRS